MLHYVTSVYNPVARFARLNESASRRQTKNHHMTKQHKRTNQEQALRANGLAALGAGLLVLHCLVDSSIFAGLAWVEESSATVYNRGGSPPIAAVGPSAFNMAPEYLYKNKYTT